MLVSAALRPPGEEESFISGRNARAEGKDRSGSGSVVELKESR